jgi:CTP-dependent riboflavin kinase
MLEVKKFGTVAADQFTTAGCDTFGSQRAEARGCLHYQQPGSEMCGTVLSGFGVTNIYIHRHYKETGRRRP